MEILSTGEKIKRARIYQGITLKELCNNKISISKMSCIENGKIKADEEILNYVSKKLELDYSYLIQDAEEQLRNNINEISKGSFSKDEIEKVISYNLEYAMENSYTEIAFELIHILFQYRLKNGNISDVEKLTSTYYDIYQNSNTKENTVIYLEDLAIFFMEIGEFSEALYYFDSVRVQLEEEEIIDKDKHSIISHKEGLCLYKANRIEEAFDKVSVAIENIDTINTISDKGEVYHLYSLVNILLNKPDADKYVEITQQLLEGDNSTFAEFLMNIGKAYYKVGNNQKGLESIKRAIDKFPMEYKVEFARFLVQVVEVLFSNGEYEFALEKIEDSLNISIEENNSKLIERSYYSKGMILQKLKRYFEAEMYMNLSTDALLKDATREERYKRYNEMGQLYYELDELKESIKYFTLAMSL